MIVKSEKSSTEKAAGANDELSFKNMREMTKYIWNNVSVEPMAGCYIIASVLSNLATQNLNLQKACRVNLQFDAETCDALERRQIHNHTAEEIAVQQLVANMSIWKSFIQSSIPAALMIFIGAWTDRTGRRKPAMIAPILGELMTSIGLIVCTYYFYELPMEVAGLVEALFPALTGGWMSMFMALYSYISDITSEEMRTLRIGFVSVFCSVGVPVGTALSGILYKKLGSYGVYTISSSLYVLSILYGYFLVKDSSPVRKSSKDDGRQREWSLIRFFDLQHVKETFMVTFKNDGNNRRIRIIMLMVVGIVVMGPLHGEMNVLYLSTRVRFNWDEVDFSLFSTYSMITNLVGTMISVCVFSQLLKIHDAIIGLMSCMSKILAGFVFAFANTAFVFCLAPIVDIINGTSFIAMRSIMSKLVAPDELGKVSSLFGVCEAIVPLIYGPMYSYVYGSTLNTMPGAFFLMGGGLTFPAAVIFWWMYLIDQKDKNDNTIDRTGTDIRDSKNVDVTQKQITRNADSNTNGLTKITNTGGDGAVPPSVQQRVPDLDVDLKTVLDRRTQTRYNDNVRLGVNNFSFLNDKEDAMSAS